MFFLQNEYCFEDNLFLFSPNYKQLLTYRPEEGPSEDANVPNDEPEAPSSEIVPVTNIEDGPPTPPAPPQNNMDTGDLLVINFIHSYCYTF